MDNSLFYINFDSLDEKENLINEIKEYSMKKSSPVYIINRPLHIINKTSEEIKKDYSYEKAMVVLTPKHKIMFINFGNNNDIFDDYIENFIDDIGYISRRYGFETIIDKSRSWRRKFVHFINNEDIMQKSFVDLLNENKLSGKDDIRKGEILISLFTGSINEADRIKGDVPENILDQIKRKIILFDGEQTKFIFNEPNKKRITVQGLAGTGKTELLLHKIKELYTAPENLRIVFTCYNVILADNLKNRVPIFFDFMKVDEQIKWDEKLWVMRSWGSQNNKNSGVYSYVCNYYNIPFQRYEPNITFDYVCKQALKYINKLENFDYCFDYMLIDESQDFSDSFFELCEKITKYCVYIAGDIFQDIFENKSVITVNPDFLLNKCYRTDPRTLMGAHAIGMGLFEKKLRWLTDEEWEACGYNIEKENGYYNLSRKPLRRFEDIENNTQNGIKIIQKTDSDYEKEIIKIIDDLIKNNPTIEPDDIGIVFLENLPVNYKLAIKLQLIIKDKFDWDVNIGYETKEKIKNKVFISNKNNVKGLEFPFIISIMQNPLINNFQIRNSIYMMLTRSFLTSYFIIPKISKYEKEIIEGINFVNSNEYLHILEPSQEEKENLNNTIINRENIYKSQYDIVTEIMEELDIIPKKRKALYEIVKTIAKNETDREKLYDIITTNLGFLD